MMYSYLCFLVKSYSYTALPVKGNFIITLLISAYTNSHLLQSYQVSSAFLAKHYSSFFFPQIKSFTELEYKFSKENGDAIIPNEYGIRRQASLHTFSNLRDSLFDSCQNTHLL